MSIEAPGEKPLRERVLPQFLPSLKGGVRGNMWPCRLMRFLIFFTMRTGTMFFPAVYKPEGKPSSPVSYSVLWSRALPPFPVLHLPRSSYSRPFLVPELSMQVARFRSEDTMASQTDLVISLYCQTSQGTTSMQPWSLPVAIFLATMIIFSPMTMVIYWPISKAPTRTGALATGLRSCTLRNPFPPFRVLLLSWSPWLWFSWEGTESSHVALPCLIVPSVLSLEPAVHFGCQTMGFQDHRLPKHMHSVHAPSDCSDTRTAGSCHSLIWSESIVSPVSAWDLYVSSSLHALLSTINKPKWNSIINHW